MRSFANPETHFEIQRSDTPHTDDGLWPGEPTGRIVCLACGEAHYNVDEIPHAETCPQRFVHSRFYDDAMHAE